MRQWCLPTVTASTEPVLTDRLSPHLSDARMDGCEVEPRYTIEQIDLLQRLRLSGMSKPQIVHALESLERLDSVPVPSQSSSSLSSSSSSLTPATTQTPSLGASPSPSNSYESSPPPLYPTSTGQRSFCYDLAEEDWDVEEKVEEYMRKDSNMVKEEIKVFLNNRRISQAIVGQVTGISQSYISQWLLQQGLEMSDPKRRAFYRWYLLERSSPGATLTLRPHVKEEPDWRASGSPIGVGAGVVTGGGAMGGAMRLRRGSRFTWRKECLSVMESFFLENQYPDEAKREEIASACNCVIQKPGCKLSECERVTALKVYNWFANRRKDMKRRANIEAAILESHGIEVLSPSCHSNAEEIDIPEFTVAEQVEVSSKDNEQDTVSLSTGMMTLQSPSPLLANQKAEELKREAADEE